MPPMKRIGIIGTGQIAQGHLRQWAEIDEVQVVMACDVEFTRRLIGG